MSLSESFESIKYQAEAEEKWGETETYREHEEKRPVILEAISISILLVLSCLSVM